MKAQYCSSVLGGNAPELFPCANRIKMPQIGTEYSSLTAEKPKVKSIHLVEPFDHTTGPVEDRYVKKISADLAFSEDVVKDRCFHMLPYDEKYLWEALDVGDLIPRPPKTKCLVGRHNTRGTDIRHVPCSITKGKITLKPLKGSVTKKAHILHQEAIKESEEKSAESEPEKKKEEKPQTAETDQTKQSESVFMTEVSEKKKDKDEKGVQPAKPPPANKEWDAYLLSIMSPLTANWVVNARMPPSEDKDNLAKVLFDWYGHISPLDLIRDDDSDTELEPKKKKDKAVKDLSNMTFLEKVKATSKGVSLDPYSEDSTAPFYRQPAGLRRKFKNAEKEVAGAINSTAHNIKMKTYEPPILPNLKDFINPAVGDYFYDTKNMYHQELLTGCKQVYQTVDESKIIMESQNKYLKQLRKEYPFSPEHWYPKTESEKLKQGPNREQQVTTIRKGSKRWTALPVPIDDTFEVLNVAPPGYDPEFHRSPDPKTRRVIKQNASLMQIISEWRAKWHLSGQFADSNTEDLLRDMTDVQPHVRLKAIATAGKAAEYRPPVEQGIQLDFEEKQMSTIDEDIFRALDCLLDDESDSVRKASAITMYSLDRPSEKAEKILRETLVGESTIDRWTAAQCLAHFGVCDSDIVGEIINQLLSTEESIKHEQGIHLLAKISNNSSLVHCLVAEQLNSSSWRHRVIACKILPTLYGTINKDLTQKLSELMWNDWHKEVRKAAAQCLGKTQHGRDVHNDLQNRILTGNEHVRQEAISRIGQLGIMTAKLLPAFLKCFDDPYMSIRLEMCITSGNLHIKNDNVIERLLQLATHDSVWKVKATAIQALGKIGVKTQEIFDCLLWAMRYEEQPVVRAEACHSLVLMDWHVDEMIDVMQERLLVETCQPVRDEMVDALNSYGVNATDDMEMVAQIKEEVRKLCTLNNITTQIMCDEMDATKRENIARMICETGNLVKKVVKKKKPYDTLLSNSEFDMAIHRHANVYDGSVKEKKDHQSRTKALFKRLRTVSTRSSLRSGEIKMDTPGVSREGTGFTPSADKELEDIMSCDGDGMTSDNLTASPMGSKSRSGSSAKSESSGKSGDDLSYCSEKDDNVNAVVTSTSSSDIPVLEVSEPRPTSNVSTLPGIPSHSKIGMTPSQSVEDINRLSRMSMGRTSERKALLSRETQMEKDKISEVSVSTYLGLDARYTNMLPLLSELDAGLSASKPGQDKFTVGLFDSPVTPRQDKQLPKVKQPKEVPVKRMDATEYDTLKHLLENFESMVQNPNLSEDVRSGASEVKNESDLSLLVDGKAQQTVEADPVNVSIPTIVTAQENQNSQTVELEADPVNVSIPIIVTAQENQNSETVELEADPVNVSIPIIVTAQEDQNSETVELEADHVNVSIPIIVTAQEDQNSETVELEADPVNVSIPTIVTAQEKEDNETIEADELPAIVVGDASELDGPELSAHYPLDETSTSTDDVEPSSSEKSKDERLQDPHVTEQQEKKHDGTDDTA